MKIGSWRSAPVVLAVITVLPFLVATGLMKSGWRPASSAVHGELLKPPVAWAAGASGELQGKWLIVYVLPDPCGRECVAALYGMRMAHLGQGDAAARVLRVVVAASPDQISRDLGSRDPQLRVLVVAPSLFASLRRTPGDGALGIVDPKGYLILRYAREADPRGMKDDLDRLLTYSWVG